MALHLVAGRAAEHLLRMKWLTLLLSLCGSISNAETADEIVKRTVPGFVSFDNGLDRSPEGRRKTAINNAESNLAHFMASDQVPEGIRISYALIKLREALRGCVYKEAKRKDGEEFAFEVDQNGAWVVDEEKTKIMRERLTQEIGVLEQRLVEISDHHPGDTK